METKIKTEDLPTVYDPKSVEDEMYKLWEKGKYFQADAKSDKPPYTIVIPPPNVTGVLHMGHALDETLQDILIRYHRMSGYEALWIPGTDHAGLATPSSVISAAIDAGSECFAKGNLLNQQALYEHLA